MFDLIAVGHQRSPHTDAVPLLVSWGLHLVIGGALIVIPLMMAAHDLPLAPSMMAFVAPEPVAAPPPPPPPAPAQSAVATPRPVPTASQFAAPVEAPSQITPEPPSAGNSDQGVPGGVEGGVPGGVVGGVVGGIPHDVPAPPPPAPPPPPAAPKGPVRVGGEISQPALIKRVDPVYPELAVQAQVEGVIILEATVDRDGRVEDVQVLRSLPLLDNAAKEAVRQWRYSPLLLNGKAERFILTVTVSFRLKRDK